MTLKIREEDLEYWYNDPGGIPTYKYNGEPFTGTMLTYEDEGWLSGEDEYENGYQEGWTRIYYRSGQIEEEYKSQNTVTVGGTYKKYDEAGNIITSW